MLHVPFSDYTDPVTRTARIITRCGEDYPVGSNNLISESNLAELSDSGDGTACSECLPSTVQLVAVKTLAASFGITSSTMRKAVLAMGIQTKKARFNGSKQHMLAITEEDAKRVRQARIAQVVEA